MTTNTKTSKTARKTQKTKQLKSNYDFENTARDIMREHGLKQIMFCSGDYFTKIELAKKRAVETDANIYIITKDEVKQLN